MRTAFRLPALLYLVLAAVALADRPATPRAHITASRDGRFSFRMIPGHPKLWDESTAYGVAEEITRDGTARELWRTKGWYAQNVHLSDDGNYLVRMGPWNDGPGPRPDHLAVAFYAKGELLKKYFTADLIKDHSRVLRSVSHYEWLAEAGSDTAYEAIRPKLDWDERFTLTTIENIRYKFDITTGEILSAKSQEEVARGWFTRADLDRLRISLIVAKYPFPYQALPRHLGISEQHKSLRAGYGGDETREVLALTDPAADRGFYGLAVTSNNPKDEQKNLTRSPLAQVVGLKLVYITSDDIEMEFVSDELLVRTITRYQENAPANETPNEAGERILKHFNGGVLRW